MRERESDRERKGESVRGQQEIERERENQSDSGR